MFAGCSKNTPMINSFYLPCLHKVNHLYCVEATPKL